MAINLNLPNFLNAPLQESPYDQVLPGLIEGYKASYLPQEKKREMEQKKLQNALLGHQGQHAQDVNKFYPRSQEQALEKGGLDIQRIQEELRWLPKEKQVAYLGKILSNQGAGISNQSAQNELNYQPRNQANKEQLDKYKIAKALYEAENPEAARMGKQSVAVQNALAAGKIPGTQPFYDFISAVNKVEYGKNNVAEGIIDPHTLQPGERKYYRQQMFDDIAKSDSAKLVLEDAEALGKLLEKHPDLSKWTASALEGKDLGILKDLALQKTTSDEKRNAIKLFKKYTSTLALQYGKVYGGGGAGTDAFRDLITSTKPELTTPKEATEALVTKLKKEMSPWVKYGKKARKVRSEGNIMHFDPYAFEETDNSGQNDNSEAIAASDEDLARIAGGGQ